MLVHGETIITRRRIAFTTDGGFIPEDELVEVLQAENSSDLFIGGCVNHETKTITFWRGDLKPLTVPFSSFEVSGDGTQPDFDQFSVVDCGQTVQLGDYEAAVDAILHENDSEYRRPISKKRLQVVGVKGSILDWCHVCGVRSQWHIELFMPENAEHEHNPSRYVRICQCCLSAALLNIAQAQAQIDDRNRSEETSD